jgi:glycosyltransferase involved in cell wall biosynthesis
MARLSVIITTFNRKGLLPKAIESVKDTGHDTEIIVVDDASSDGTKEFCEKLDGIRYIRLDKNSGTAAARNEGIRLSSSDIIAFLDDDDWRLPGSFTPQLEVLEKNNGCAVVYGKVYYADQNHELTGQSNILQETPNGDVLLELLHRNFITLSSVVARKDYIINAGMFDTSRKMLGLEDWDLWLRLSTQYELRGIQEPVAVYRRPEKDSGQWYSDLGRQYSLAATAYRKKWFALPGVKDKLGDEFARTKRKILSHTSDIIIYSALTNSKTSKEKMRRMAKAVKCWPRNLVSLRFYKGIFRAFFNGQTH